MNWVTNVIAFVHRKFFFFGSSTAARRVCSVLFVFNGSARANIKFCFGVLKTATETNEMLRTVYGNEVLSFSNCLKYSGEDARTLSLILGATASTAFTGQQLKMLVSL